MKEKLMNIKDKVVEYAKKGWEWMKTNPLITSVVGFSVVSLVLILVAMLALQEFVVSVCILIIIEAAMAALLHQAEIWKHGILLGVQLLAGIIIKRIPLIIICIIAYVAATFALQLMGKKNEQA
ncbi:MAG: hypothetical protein IJA07_11365 [Agathobacter sp.]|nr:hypothetical protein [Agathobacter sp.]